MGRVTRTGQPASDRRRTAAKPSLPLPRGPHSTRIGRGLQRFIAACATGSLVFSIRRISLMPQATVNWSASGICALVSRAVLSL